jgi:hypothetical protein
MGRRGRFDVEKPVGEWNTLVITADDKKIEVDLNGVLVNRGTNPSVTRGKFSISYYLCENYFRKFEVWPLEQS